MIVLSCVGIHNITKQIMELISKSEGLIHVCESILMHLDHKTLLSCLLVNSNFKRVLDNPKFWIKILKNIYGLKDLGQELESIETHIGDSKYEEEIGTKKFSKNFWEALEQSFPRSLIKV